MMKMVQMAMTIVTGQKAQKRGKGRPSLSFGTVPLDLVDLWEAVTEKQIVSPKEPPKYPPPKYPKVQTRTAGLNQTPLSTPHTQSSQPSTEFVRLALQMIDPTITAAKARTAIRKVLFIRKLYVAAAGSQLSGRKAAAKRGLDVERLFADVGALNSKKKAHLKTMRSARRRTTGSASARILKKQI